MRKEKIMKSMSFKSREEMVAYLQEGSNYKGKPKIVKVKPMSESEYWEMKAEVHFGL